MWQRLDPRRLRGLDLNMYIHGGRWGGWAPPAEHGVPVGPTGSSEAPQQKRNKVRSGAAEQIEPAASGAADARGTPGPAYGDTVILDSRVGFVAPLEVQPAEAPLSVMSVERAGDDLFWTAESYFMDMSEF